MFDAIHVTEINVTERRTLREVLRIYDVLNQVETSRSIVMTEGKSLTDLDMMVLPGQRLVIVPLGGHG